MRYQIKQLGTDREPNLDGVIMAETNKPVHAFSICNALSTVYHNQWFGTWDTKSRTWIDQRRIRVETR